MATVAAPGASRLLHLRHAAVVRAPVSGEHRRRPARRLAWHRRQPSGIAKARTAHPTFVDMTGRHSGSLGGKSGQASAIGLLSGPAGRRDVNLGLHLDHDAHHVTPSSSDRESDNCNRAGSHCLKSSTELRGAPCVIRHGGSGFHTAPHFTHHHGARTGTQRRGVHSVGSLFATNHHYTSDNLHITVVEIVIAAGIIGVRLDHGPSETPSRTGSRPSTLHAYAEASFAMRSVGGDRDCVQRSPTCPSIANRGMRQRLNGGADQPRNGKSEALGPSHRSP